MVQNSSTWFTGAAPPSLFLSCTTITMIGAPEFWGAKLEMFSLSQAPLFPQPCLSNLLSCSLRLDFGLRISWCSSGAKRKEWGNDPEWLLKTQCHLPIPYSTSSQGWSSCFETTNWEWHWRSLHDFVRWFGDLWVHRTRRNWRSVSSLGVENVGSSYMATEYFTLYNYWDISKLTFIISRKLLIGGKPKKNQWRKASKPSRAFRRCIFVPWVRVSKHVETLVTLW